MAVYIGKRPQDTLKNPSSKSTGPSLSEPLFVKCAFSIQGPNAIDNIMRNMVKYDSFRHHMLKGESNMYNHPTKRLIVCGIHCISAQWNMLLIFPLSYISTVINISSRY